MGQQIVGTLAGRWYVTIFGVTFLAFALRHLGARRTAIYSAVAVAVGVIAENGSVRYGFPYTHYSFDPALRDHELFVGDVPLMVSLSYTFMSYFAFAAARLLVGGPYRSRSSWAGMEYVVAVMLAVWALWVIDPVSRLGRFFFLGELFHYDGPGFWFGLPLGSQLGFALTSAILVGVLTSMMRDEPTVAVERLRDHPRLPALGAYVGQVLFMTGTAFWVARTVSDPGAASMADALVGTTFLIGVPMALMTAVHWRAAAATKDAAIDGDPPMAHVHDPREGGVGSKRR
jgi:putative membrane protein